MIDVIEYHRDHKITAVTGDRARARKVRVISIFLDRHFPYAEKSSPPGLINRTLMSSEMNSSKIPAYIRERLFGLTPLAAALAAGYSPAGIGVAAARLESREDVRQALRKVEAVKAPTGRLISIEDGEAISLGWRLKKKYEAPLELLLDVMNNPHAPAGLRIQCAKDALPYCHARIAGAVR